MFRIGDMVMQNNNNWFSGIIMEIDNFHSLSGVTKTYPIKIITDFGKEYYFSMNGSWESSNHIIIDILSK